MRLSAAKIKVLTDWMKHHGFDSILQVLSNLYQDPNSIDLTEKIKGALEDHKMQHNDGKDSFLGSLLVLAAEL